MPLTFSSAPEILPGSRPWQLRHTAHALPPLPSAHRCQHSTALTHRCRYPAASPPLGSSSVARQALGTQQPSHLMLPSTLAAAQLPAGPASFATHPPPLWWG